MLRNAGVCVFFELPLQATRGMSLAIPEEDVDQKDITIPLVHKIARLWACFCVIANFQSCCIPVLSRSQICRFLCLWKSIERYRYKCSRLFQFNCELRFKFWFVRAKKNETKKKHRERRLCIATSRAATWPSRQAARSSSLVSKNIKNHYRRLSLVTFFVGKWHVNEITITNHHSVNIWWKDIQDRKITVIFCQIYCHCLNRFCTGWLRNPLRRVSLSLSHATLIQFVVVTSATPTYALENHLDNWVCKTIPRNAHYRYENTWIKYRKTVPRRPLSPLLFDLIFFFSKDPGTRGADEVFLPQNCVTCTGSS